MHHYTKVSCCYDIVLIWVYSTKEYLFRNKNITLSIFRIAFVVFHGNMKANWELGILRSSLYSWIFSAPKITLAITRNVVINLNIYSFSVHASQILQNKIFIKGIFYWYTICIEMCINADYGFIIKMKSTKKSTWISAYWYFSTLVNSGVNAYMKSL